MGLPYYVYTKSFCNDSIITQEVRTDYDNRYLPVRKTSFVNGNITSQELCEYNDRFQLTKQEQCFYESTDWLSKEFVYSPDGHLLKETNAMGMSTDYAYDPKTGFLQSSTDHKGRTTYYEYDTWGRLVEAYYPGGHMKQVPMEWSREGEPGTYAVIAIETGKPMVKVYYDFLKREVCTSQIRFEDRKSVV